MSLAAAVFTETSRTLNILHTMNTAAHDCMLCVRYCWQEL